MRVHLIHIQNGGVRHRVANGGLGDFRKGNPLCGARVQLQKKRRGIGDVLALAVSVRCQINVGGALGGFLELLDGLGFLLYPFVLWLPAVVHSNGG